MACAPCAAGSVAEPGPARRARPGGPAPDSPGGSREIPPETVVDASSTMEGIPIVHKHQEGLRHTAEKPSSVDNFDDLLPAHLNGLLQSHRCKSWHDTPLGAVMVTGMAADSASNLTSTCSGVNPGPSSRAMSSWMVARKEAAKSLFAESIERFRFCAMMKRTHSTTNWKLRFCFCPLECCGLQNTCDAIGSTNSWDAAGVRKSGPREKSEHK